MTQFISAAQHGLIASGLPRTSLEIAYLRRNLKEQCFRFSVILIIDVHDVHLHFSDTSAYALKSRSSSQDASA